MLSALVPVFNAEVYVVGAAALLPRAIQPMVVLLFTLGTMAGKAVLYLAAANVMRGSSSSLKSRVESWVEQLQRHRRYAWPLVFASALVGVPPFYAVSLAAGTLRLGLPSFLLLGSAGRFLRFSAITWAVKGWTWT